MKRAFTFTFDVMYKNNDTRILAIIPFKSEPEGDEDDIADLITDKCDEYDLESIGVHDWSSGEIYNSKYESAYGFNTYEVEYNKIKSLMKTWKKILDELGFETEEIIFTENFKVN